MISLYLDMLGKENATTGAADIVWRVDRPI